MSLRARPLYVQAKPAELQQYRYTMTGPQKKCLDVLARLPEFCALWMQICNREPACLWRNSRDARCTPPAWPIPWPLGALAHTGTRIASARHIGSCAMPRCCASSSFRAQSAALALCVADGRPSDTSTNAPQTDLHKSRRGIEGARRCARARHDLQMGRISLLLP